MTTQFRERFATDVEPRLWRAPGRVNLIGEHTDYNLGFVMPIAIQMACFGAAAPNREGKLRVYSANEQNGAEWPLEEALRAHPAKRWTDYVLGVLQQLHGAGLPMEGMDILIDSTVPVGAGLSSSAAIEVASALSLLNGALVEKLVLAQMCQRAEREYIGLPSGIMDQYVSVFGEAHAAIELDCRSLRHEAVGLPDGAKVIAANSMVKHELGGSAYRDRVAECAEAVRFIQQREPEVQSLRDVSSESLRRYEGEMPDVPFRRARHITGENERVLAFAEACRAGDLRRMGELFMASHRSMRDDYEISCEEIDFLVDTAVTLPGVYGARMTGGGFGGCTVNLVRPDEVERFEGEISRRYQGRYGKEPEIYRCEASAGAGGLG